MLIQYKVIKPELETYEICMQKKHTNPYGCSQAQAQGRRVGRRDSFGALLGSAGSRKLAWGLKFRLGGVGWGNQGQHRLRHGRRGRRQTGGGQAAAKPESGHAGEQAPDGLEGSLETRSPTRLLMALRQNASTLAEHSDARRAGRPVQTVLVVK